MAIKTKENFIPFSNSVTFRKPRGTDLVTASELIPGFCRSKSNVPTPGSLCTIKSPTAGIVPGIKSPPLARTPPHGIYTDRCIILTRPNASSLNSPFDTAETRTELPKTRGCPYHCNSWLSSTQTEEFDPRRIQLYCRLF